MPTKGEVRSTVADLVVQLTGVASADVTPATPLADLGIDSLLVVELAEELGRRHGVYLSDDTVDGLHTVEDAVRAVTEHDGSAAPAWVRKASSGGPGQDTRGQGTPGQGTRLDVEGVDPESALTVHDEPFDKERVAGNAMGTGVAMVIVGAIVGVALGFATATALNAAGLGSSTLPPIATPTTATTTEASPTPTETTATPSTDPEEDAIAEPSLSASSTTVPPGQRFTLSGAIPEAGPGAELQVQVRDAGGEWDDFPVTLTAGDGGAFSAEVYTSRTGARDWRLVQPGTGLATPAVTVTIG